MSLSLLPNKIIIYPNPDKENQDTWINKQKSHYDNLKLYNEERKKQGFSPFYKAFDMCNYPHPVKICGVGNTNRGKSNIVKNIIDHQFPPFTKIVRIKNLDNSHEYDNWDIIQKTEIPDQSFFSDGKKTLVILDDLDFTSLNKKNKANLVALYGRICTHSKGYISIIACTHGFFQLDPKMKRMSDVFYLWKPNDETEISLMAKKVGLTPNKLNMLFNDLCKTRYDYIVVDKTENSPYKYRLNSYDIIKFKDDYK
jgi:hypothetical protein